MDIRDLLGEACAVKASDLHITVNAPPVFRINGELSISGKPLQPSDTEAMAHSLMTQDEWRQFEQNGEVDFSFSLPGVSRFRVNVYRQRGCVSIAARVVPTVVPRLDDLGLPTVLKTFTSKPHGLVLVTGPTGSGKSTTLAALIDHINHTQRRRVITLEDPIEYLHKHHLSIIDQREIGHDTMGFAPALRAALRQDPDVILIGEMRDLETIQIAITAAETGHLVFATLHTSDAVQTIDRIVDVFPAVQQTQIRVQLAAVLQGIVSQRLLKTTSGNSRVAALEILVNTPAIANLIRTEKGHQIRSMMQTGRSYGMQTMDMHIRELVANGRLSASALQQFNSNLGAM